MTLRAYALNYALSTTGRTGWSRWDIRAHFAEQKHYSSKFRRLLPPRRPASLVVLTVRYNEHMLIIVSAVAPGLVRWRGVMDAGTR